MTARLSRADFEAMTVGELLRAFDRPAMNATLVLSFRTKARVATSGGQVLEKLEEAAQLGWFDPHPEAGR